MADQSKTSNLMSTPSELTVLTSYLLRQAALRAQAEASLALSNLSLRPPHHSVMAMIEAKPKSQAALSAQLQTDRSTMVSIVDDLERMKLAERRVSPDDRRVHDVTLTEAGQQTLALTRSALEEVDDRLLEGLSDTERQDLRRVLFRIIENYERRQKSKGDNNAS